MRTRTTAALLVAAAAAFGPVTTGSAYACQYSGDDVSVCAGYDADDRCVYANGHVDVYEYRIACSPR